MSSSMRTILPKYWSVENSGSTDVTTKRKRTKLLKCACNTCRARKTACDGIRPSCGWCTSHNLVCEYVTQDTSETSSMALKRENEDLRRRVHDLEMFLSNLSKTNDAAALSMLGSLRSSGDFDKARQGPSTPPNEQVSPSVPMAQESQAPPETAMELRLIAQYPSAYPSKNDAEDALFARITSDVRWASDLSEANSDTDDLGNSMLKTREDPSSPLIPVAHQTMPYGQPTPPEILVAEPWTITENITSWTKVDVSATYILTAISTYLEIDHPILGALDAELFLESFFNIKGDFCCPLLVNGMLAYASTHVQSSLSNNSLRRQFLDEAVNVLKETDVPDSLTRISGFVHLSLVHTSQGEGEMGMKYLQEAMQMAKRMHLFGSTRMSRCAASGPNDYDLQRMAAQVAWGTYNQVHMHGLFHTIEPAGQPPLLTVPVSGTLVYRTCHLGDESYCLRLDCSSVFGLFCDLWSVISEIMAAKRPSTKSSASTCASSLAQFDQLLAITKDMPEDVLRSNVASREALTFHIWYHAVILDLFRPHVARHGQSAQRSVTLCETLAADIYAASVKQLKRLLVIYMTSIQNAQQSIWWHIAPLCIANDVVKETEDKDWRIYFTLCLHAYRLFLRYFDVARGVIEGLLALAMESEAIDAKEAIGLAEQLGRAQSTCCDAQPSSGLFVLDLDRAVLDPNAAIMDELAARFRDVRTFHEFTRDDFDLSELI